MATAKPPSIRKAASIRSFGAISDAVDALYERGDQREWNDLLQGCRFEPESFVCEGEPVGDILGGPSFNATKSSERRWLDHAMRVVLARAPADFAAAVELRDAVTSLCLRTAASDARAHTDFEPLAAFSNLARLLLRRVNETLNLDAIARMPALTWLRFEDGGLDSIAPLAGAPRLESLELDRLSDLASLSTLASLPALRAVRVSNVSGLHSLADFAALRSLESLSIEVSDGATTITDLHELASLKALRRLSLVGFSALTDLSALASFAALEELSLAGASSLVDVSALSKVTSLRAIDLSGCGALTDVSSLVSLPSLRALLLKASGVGARAIPRELREVATARKDATMRELLFEAEARDALAKRPTELDPRNHPAWTKLSPLLFGKEIENVDLGVELVAGFNDATLFDAIFYDVRWVTPAHRPPRPWKNTPVYGALVPDATTVLPHSPAVMRDRALLGLLALAPEEATRARALRDEAVAVDIEGQVELSKMIPVDLRPLKKLPNLEKLTVSRATEIVGLDLLAHTSKLRELNVWSGHVAALGTHHHLESLTLRGLKLDDASGIPAATELRSLRLEGITLPKRLELRDLSKLTTFALASPSGLNELSLTSLPSLREVSVSYAHTIRSLTLRECASLRSLALSFVGGPSVRFEALPSLAKVSLSSVTPMASFEGLGELVGLEEIVVSWSDADLRSLFASLPAGLKSITLQHAWTAVDLEALKRFTRLETLRVRDHRTLRDISALASLASLRELALERCPQVSDAMTLEALPSLRSLSVSGSGIKRAKLSARLRSMIR